MKLAPRPGSDGPWVLVSEGADGKSRAAVAAVRALAQSGYRPTVTETNGRSLAGASRSCARRVTVPAAAGDGVGYAEAIAAELATRLYVTSFIATDAALLALSAPVGQLLDKAMCAELANAGGLEFPPMQVFDSGVALRSAAQHLAYSVVVKPALKLSAAQIVDNSLALDATIAASVGRVLVQPVTRSPFTA